ncbi:hypothetical protein TNCV_4687891 [Trichonephila clavipes]|nr:hypothetical protein TNCV_4687891 [Trichonephila clavipes]
MSILGSKTVRAVLPNGGTVFETEKYPIQKAMIDLNLKIIFSDSEFYLISRTVSGLLPIKLAVESLCQRDSNLLTEKFGTAIEDDDDTNACSEKELSLEQKIELAIA